MTLSVALGGFLMYLAVWFGWWIADVVCKPSESGVVLMAMAAIKAAIVAFLLVLFFGGAHLVLGQ